MMIHPRVKKRHWKHPSPTNTQAHNPRWNICPGKQNLKLPQKVRQNCLRCVWHFAQRLATPPLSSCQTPLRASPAFLPAPHPTWGEVTCSEELLCKWSSLHAVQYQREKLLGLPWGVPLHFGNQAAILELPQRGVRATCGRRERDSLCERHNGMAKSSVNILSLP